MFSRYYWPSKEQWCAFWKEIGKVFVFYKIFVFYSGVLAIWEKVNPPATMEMEKINYRKPATFPLWVVGIYVAFFGVASQRYENRVDIIENRANAIFTQLSTPAYKKALSQVPRVQRMRCPINPDILNPFSVWQSLFSADTVYQEIVEHLKATIVTWKAELDSVDLSGAILNGADMSSANLQGANLIGAYLCQANFQGVNLIGASLREANLNGANLNGDTISVAVITGSNTSNADSTRHVVAGNFFHGIDFLKYFPEVKLATIDLHAAVLSNADLYKAKLDSANFELAILIGTNLTEANLCGVNLDGAIANGANFTGANLNGANLRVAHLKKTFFNGANLIGTNLDGAILVEADLREVNEINVEQLCISKSLYHAKMEWSLLDQVKAKCPHLLEEPNWKELAEW